MFGILHYGNEALQAIPTVTLVFQGQVMYNFVKAIEAINKNNNTILLNGILKKRKLVIFIRPDY